MWKAVSFSQSPPVFLFCVQGFLGSCCCCNCLLSNCLVVPVKCLGFSPVLLSGPVAVAVSSAVCLCQCFLLSVHGLSPAPLCIALYLTLYLPHRSTLLPSSTTSPQHPVLCAASCPLAPALASDCLALLSALVPVA